MMVNGLSFIGDTFLNGKVESKIRFDEFVLNLEFAITQAETPAKNKINLKAHDLSFENVFGKNPLAVNLANNHIFDFEEKGFRDTINFLEKNKIKYFGAGNANNNYNNPLNVSYGGLKIALLGYCCISTNPNYDINRESNVALIDIEKIKQDIQKCRTGNIDFIVVNLHWGIEEVCYPKPKDAMLAKQIIDLGGDLVIGHHAHVIQSKILYKGKYIFFGLGNFIFPNLKVNSYFDGTKYTRQYIKNQVSSNRKSIFVTLLESLELDYGKTYFNGLEVKKMNGKSVPYWVPSSEFSFKIYLFFLYRKSLLMKFIRSPKLPKAKHLKAFLSKSFNS